MQNLVIYQSEGFILHLSETNDNFFKDLAVKVLNVDINDDFIEGLIEASGSSEDDIIYNSKTIYTWDVIFSRLPEIAHKYGYICKRIKKSSRTIYVVINQNDGELFLFMNADNYMENIKKKSHYSNILLSKNPSNFNDKLSEDGVTKQLSLFSTNVNSRLINRNNEIKDYLGEYFNSFNKTLIITRPNDVSVSSDLTLKYYSKEGNLIDLESFPNYDFNDPNDSDINNIPNNKPENDKKLNLKLKKNVLKKDYKNHLGD